MTGEAETGGPRSWERQEGPSLEPVEGAHLADTLMPNVKPREPGGHRFLLLSATEFGPFVSGAPGPSHSRLEERRPRHPPLRGCSWELSWGHLGGEPAQARALPPVSGRGSTQVSDQS